MRRPTLARMADDIHLAMRAYGGRWNTTRALAALKKLGYIQPSRTDGRRALHILAQRGQAVLHDEPNNRYFTLPGGERR
ncbi:MAG TPA: hypothetical protein VFY14_10925 [Streptomyces sp.]|nr:hypothetical protein [Streptomyces sp.]